MDVDPLIEYVRQHSKALVLALEDYRQNPVLVRNMFAENGKEVTPDELKLFCDLLESLIIATDE